MSKRNSLLNTRMPSNKNTQSDKAYLNFLSHATLVLLTYLVTSKANAVLARINTRLNLIVIKMSHRLIPYFTELSVYIGETLCGQLETSYYTNSVITCPDGVYGRIVSLYRRFDNALTEDSDKVMEICEVQVYESK